MRKQVGIFVAAVLYYSGLVGLARWLMQQRGSHLIILNYHRASTGDLYRHLLYLRRHYRVLHLEKALEELFQPDRDKQKRQDRRTALVVTFDDGYYDMYTHAFVLARKLQVPISIFLIPGYIENKKRFWWKEGRYLAQHTQVEQVTIAERTYQLRDPAERGLLAQSIDHSLRHARSVAEREELLSRFRQVLSVPDEVAEEQEKDRSIGWEEAREMLQSGRVSLGAHTMHHPVLAYMSDANEVRYEIGECRQKLEQNLSRPVYVFAYPIGKTEHIDETAIQAVRDAGYRWAVTTLRGINTPDSDPYQLRRVASEVSRHWLVMAAETSGIWYLFSPVWKVILDKEKVSNLIKRFL